MNTDREQPTHALATGLGALTILGTATALTPLISDASWLVPVTLIAAVIWFLGVGGRLLRLPVWTVEVLQFVGYLLTVTGLYLSDGVLRVLPGPAAVREGVALLTEAIDAVATTVPPAPATIALQFLIGLAFGAIVLVTDLLIAGARIPALVGLPVLAVYTVPTAIAIEDLPLYSLVLTAAGYLALLVVDHGLRPGPVGPPRAGTWLRALAAGAVTVVLALVVSSAATGVGTAGRIARTPVGTDTVSINPWALLRGELTSGDDIDVLRVTGSAAPAYLRTFALEHWEPGSGFGLATIEGQPVDGSGRLGAPPAEEADAAAAEVTVTAQRYRDRYLPIYPDTRAVTGLGDGWRYDASTHVVFRGEATTPDPYTIDAPTSPPTRSELRAEAVTAAPGLTTTGDLPIEVVTLARSITAAASTPFERAEAVLDFFTDPANGFTYSLATPSGHTGDALTDFLTHRAGYCEQYAAAMAIMLRAVGVPARVGIGFTQGTPAGPDEYQVASRNAHAWVEVPFADSGWVNFDPTPPVGGQGGLQGFTEDDGSPAEPSSPQPTSTPTTDATAEQSPATNTPAASPAVTPTQAAADADAEVADPPAAIGIPVAVLTGIAAALVLVVLLLLLPGRIRARRRRRHLARASAGGPGAGDAAWSELWATAVDHRIGGDAGSARTRANALARAARLESPDRNRLRAIVEAAERDWYASAGAARTGADPGDRDGLSTEAGLSAGAGLGVEAGPGSRIDLDGDADLTGGAGQGGGTGRGADLDGQADLGAALAAVIQAMAAALPRGLPDRVWPRSVRPGSPGAHRH